MLIFFLSMEVLAIFEFDECPAGFCILFFESGKSFLSLPQSHFLLIFVVQRALTLWADNLSSLMEIHNILPLLLLLHRPSSWTPMDCFLDFSLVFLIICLPLGLFLGLFLGQPCVICSDLGCHVQSSFPPLTLSMGISRGRKNLLVCTNCRGGR